MVKKSYLIIMLVFLSTLAACGEATVSGVDRYFLSIDIREDGECKVPLVYKIPFLYYQNKYATGIYSNPFYGAWGTSSDSIDPASGMVQNCRLLIGSPSEKEEELDIHILNPQTGWEAHEHIKLTPLDILDYDECKFLKSDDGLEYDIHKDMDKYRKCGDRLKNEVQYTINLQPPQSDEAFDWVNELECQPIN